MGLPRKWPSFLHLKAEEGWGGQSLFLWRYSRPTWTRSCAACSRWPCFGRRVGLDDPQRSLPAPNILWLSDSVFCPCVTLTIVRELEHTGRGGFCTVRHSSGTMILPVWAKSKSKWQVCPRTLRHWGLEAKPCRGPSCASLFAHCSHEVFKRVKNYIRWCPLQVCWCFVFLHGNLHVWTKSLKENRQFSFYKSSNNRSQMLMSD